MLEYGVDCFDASSQLFASARPRVDASFDFIDTGGKIRMRNVDCTGDVTQAKLFRRPYVENLGRRSALTLRIQVVGRKGRRDLLSGSDAWDKQAEYAEDGPKNPRAVHHYILRWAVSS